jgi:hypothetical protein
MGYIQGGRPVDFPVGKRGLGPAGKRVWQGAAAGASGSAVRARAYKCVGFDGAAGGAGTREGLRSALWQRPGARRGETGAGGTCDAGSARDAAGARGACGRPAAGRWGGEGTGGAPDWRAAWGASMADVGVEGVDGGMRQWGWTRVARAASAFERSRNRGGPQCWGNRWARRAAPRARGGSERPRRRRGRVGARAHDQRTAAAMASCGISSAAAARGAAAAAAAAAGASAETAT